MTITHHDRDPPPTHVHLHVEVETDSQTVRKVYPLVGTQDLESGTSLAGIACAEAYDLQSKFKTDASGSDGNGTRNQIYDD